MTTENSRAVASFLGLAIGDALGAPVEFELPGSFEPVVDYRSGGPWNLPRGYWTDDTSMAICLAESIIACNRINPVDLMQRFCRWFQQGENSSTGTCFDIGNTTVQALRRYLHSGSYEPARNLEYLSGNGSIMRLSPVAVRWWNQPDVLEDTAIAQSVVTHGSDECVRCCRELAALLGAAIRGEPVHQSLQQWASSITSNEVSNSGRAVDTFSAAKWAVGSSNNFSSAVLAAVNLGGDSDTIGAVAGQLAGAIWGMESIPQAWVDDLYQNQKLLSLAQQLWEKSIKSSVAAQSSSFLS
jgi:ADP-ribosyl-[dinitrogen reductase] hydrolase